MAWFTSPNAREMAGRSNEPHRRNAANREALPAQIEHLLERLGSLLSARESEEKAIEEFTDALSGLEEQVRILRGRSAPPEPQRMVGVLRAGRLVVPRRG
jgi:hypothetical protein